LNRLLLDERGNPEEVAERGREEISERESTVKGERGKRERMEGAKISHFQL